MTDEMSPKEIGRRLRAVRLALDYGDQNAMAQRMGISRNRYNNWEVGIGPIPVDQAIVFCRVTGVSLDYIYRGDASGLPMRIFKLLPSELKAG